MNKFEDKLRSLRPAILPDALKLRLENEPELRVENAQELRAAVASEPSTAVPQIRAGSFRRWLRPMAAAAVVIIVGYSLAALRSGLRPVPASLPAAASSIVFTNHKEHLVTGVRPVTTFRDASNHPWRLVEVSWTEQDTLVSATRPTLLRLEEHRTALVPVAIHFD